jgi:hypothetical protein
MSFGGREMSILYRNGVCIPKLELGNDEVKKMYAEERLKAEIVQEALDGV